MNGAWQASPTTTSTTSPLPSLSPTPQSTIRVHRGHAAGVRAVAVIPAPGVSALSLSVPRSAG